MAFSRVRIFSASRTLSSLRFRNFRLRFIGAVGGAIVDRLDRRRLPPGQCHWLSCRKRSLGLIGLRFDVSPVEGNLNSFFSEAIDDSLSHFVLD